MFSKESTFSYIWRSIITACTILSAIYIPLRIVFNLNTNVDLFYFDWIITIIFISDFVYNFIIKINLRNNKSDFTRDELSRYSFGWLLIDFIAAFPFYLIWGMAILQILRIIKLIRVAQYMHELRQRVLRFGDYLNLGFFIFWLLLLIHWFACGWVVLYGFPSGTDNYVRYINSLYWCIQTFTTVGYGDITPINNVQHIYSMVVMLLGVGVYGYLIGNVANILSKRDPAKALYFENIESLKAFSNFRNIPIGIQKKIRDYFAYIWKKRLGYDESAFISKLPSGLQDEVSLFLKRDILEKIPLFKGIDDRFLKEMSLHLRPLVFTPGEYVFKEGDKGNEMYFVIRGRLEVVENNNTKVRNILKDGDFFGEIALFKNINRTAGIRAVTYSDLYILEKDVFNYCLESYPEITDQIKATAEKRINESNKYSG
jgi:Cyclic nucleotide-binding domain/Ion transport protein